VSPAQSQQYILRVAFLKPRVRHQPTGVARAHEEDEEALNFREIKHKLGASHYVHTYINKESTDERVTN
jgi:hypothetical protein